MAAALGDGVAGFGRAPARPPLRASRYDRGNVLRDHFHGAVHCEADLRRAAAERGARRGDG
eukprot:1961355-Prymnesium_polylepis.1